MQRRVLSEFMVAFVVLAMLGLAIVFAGLLSVSTAQPEATATETATSTHTPTSTATPTPTLTATNSPTATDAATHTLTSTLIMTPTLTQTATASFTPTETASATPTETATATSSVTPTATETELPITTPRPIDAAAIRSLFAEVVTAIIGEVDFERSTSVASVPTNTPALRATFTSVYTPTSTPTSTATPEPTATLTVTPTVTVTLTHTSTISPTATITSSMTPDIESSDCVLPVGWMTYRVRTGDTLFRIALTTGSSVNELRQVNCLRNIDYLYVGQLLFVPDGEQHPASSTDNNVTDSEQISREGCSLSNVQITSPVPLQRIAGRVVFYGTAQTENFAYYRVDVRPDNDPVYTYYTDATEPVESSSLFVLDTRRFKRGLYWVRLSVIDQQGFVDDELTCAIPIFFD